MSTATIQIQGMTCSGCVNSVTKALEQVDGVKTASVDLEKNQADVTFDEAKTNINALKEAVQEAGYETK